MATTTPARSQGSVPNQSVHTTSVGSDAAGEEVHGPGAFDALGLAVDGERDAPATQDVVAEGAVVAQVVGGEGVEPVDDRFLAVAGRAVWSDCLVVEAAEVVVVEEAAHHGSTVVRYRRPRWPFVDSATVESGPEPVAIGPDEVVDGRPCTDTGLYAADRGLLAYMLQDVRALARLWADGSTDVVAYEPIIWWVHGLKRRLVPCDLDRLVDGCDLEVVGFFGSRRPASEGGLGPDADPIDDLDARLTAEFRRYPGIASYSTIEMDDGFWANLVLHSVPSDAEDWRGSDVHRGAVRMSPTLYRDVRIHNGRLPGGVRSMGEVVLSGTKYWDYGPVPDAEPTWTAVRRW